MADFVLAGVLLIGAGATRLQSRGMVRVMYATALVQMLVALIARAPASGSYS